MRTENKTKKKKHRLNTKKFIRFAAFIIVIAAAAAVLFWPVDVPVPEIPEEPEPVYKRISIAAAGDIMAHMPQVEAAKKADGTYDFDDSFKYVKTYLESADLSLANIETTFSGDGTYSGYPGFDSPDNLATDVSELGIDVAWFANNHMLDTKLAGAKRTAELLRQNGMTVVGARLSTDEDRFAVVEKNGLKIGIVAYTYETPLVNGQRTLNGSSGSGMNAGAPDYINTFRYYKLDEDKKAIAADIAGCREKGAEIVICYLHWGNEYHTSPSKEDQALARYLAENGADVIFASHPHVLQKIDTISVEVDYPDEWVNPPVIEPEIPEDPLLIKIRKAIGLIKEEEPEPEPEKEPRPASWTKTVPVFYSMGNFVSNQRTESLKETYGEDTSRRTEQGMIAQVELCYCEDNGHIDYEKISYIPTWVDRYSSGGRMNYRIIPLVEGFENNEALKTSGHTGRAKAALAEITKTVNFPKQ